MCGIVYAHNFDGSPVNNAILQQFDQQRHRGVQGFGVFDGDYMNMVHETKEDKMLKWLVRYDSSLLLMHHRYPTSTVNVKKAAHPFSTKDYFGNTQYILVHNGVLANADDRFVEHQEYGIEYQSLLQDMTFNDSEALLWDFARYMEGEESVLKSVGRIAFIALKKVDGKLTNLYFGRNNGNPLNLVQDQFGIELSSEGDGAAISVHTLYDFEYATKKLDQSYLKIEEYMPYKPYNSNNACQQSTYPYRSAPDLAFDDDGLDEPVSFDDEYEEKWTGHAGDWLDKKTKGKYRKLLKQLDVNKQAKALGDGYPSDLASKVEVIDRDYRFSFTAAEIQKGALEYLLRFYGNFEQAYWALEMDYEDAQFEEDSYTNWKHIAYLEKLLDFISSDPEYKNEDSVSSLFLSIKAQAALTV